MREVATTCSISWQNTMFAAHSLSWGPVARHYPDLIRRIAREGHELGCHGWSHDLVYEMTPERFREETQRASAAISDVTAQPVTAYRAAYFSITARSLWALDILAELGFQCDSSIFPVHNWRYGIPDFDLAPRIVKTASGPICEIPISVRQVGKMRLPVTGGAYFRLYPYFVSRANMRAVSKQRRAVIFLSASVGTRPRSSTGRILLEGAFDPLRQFESNRASIAATIDRFLFLSAARNCNADKKDG